MNLDGIKNRLIALQEFIILKGGKRDLSKLIKVKRPYKKNGKQFMRDTWIRPEDAKKNDVILNEHDLHHLLPENHPDHKTTKNDSKKPVKTLKEKDTKKPVKNIKEKDTKKTVKNTKEKEEKPKTKKPKITEKVKKHLFDRLRTLTNLYEDDGAWGSIKNNVNKGDEKSDGWVSPNDKDGDGYLDSSLLGKFDPSDLVGVVKELGGETKKDKNGQILFRLRLPKGIDIPVTPIEIKNSPPKSPKGKPTKKVDTGSDIVSNVKEGKEKLKKTEKQKNADFDKTVKLLDSIKSLNERIKGTDKSDAGMAEVEGIFDGTHKIDENSKVVEKKDGTNNFRIQLMIGRIHPDRLKLYYPNIPIHEGSTDIQRATHILDQYDTFESAIESIKKMQEAEKEFRESKKKKNKKSIDLQNEQDLTEDEKRHLELKSKYNSEIANLVKLESKINQWFNTSHVGRETKTRYEKEDRWEKAYNKAKATPEWDNYCKQERKSKSYDFADVCA